MWISIKHVCNLSWLCKNLARSLQWCHNGKLCQPRSLLIDFLKNASATFVNYTVSQPHQYVWDLVSMSIFHSQPLFHELQLVWRCLPNLQSSISDKAQGLWRLSYPRKCWTHVHDVPKGFCVFFLISDTHWHFIQCPDTTHDNSQSCSGFVWRDDIEAPKKVGKHETCTGLSCSSRARARTLHQKCIHHFCITCCKEAAKNPAALKCLAPKHKLVNITVSDVASPLQWC